MVSPGPNASERTRSPSRTAASSASRRPPEAISVSVGDVPESGLGELGGGVGLRLSFAEGLLRVWHRVELVHEQPLPGYWCQLDVTINPPEQVCRSDADGTFRPASVAWREDGLHVSLGGDDLLVRFPFGWAPLPGWRMALAARTGRGFGRQWVRAVALRTDAAVHHRALPLAVAWGKMCDISPIASTH